jgi:uncharacterized protein (DUF488 family)
MHRILTIGHSNLSAEAFFALLSNAGVSILADVRSSPWSKYLPHFNGPALARTLDDAGFSYAFLGNGLGARPKDPKCYRGGVALYGLIAGTTAFEAGLAAVRDLARSGTVAMMCSEKDPMECHRAILVARRLASGADVGHVHSDGSIETHAELEARLLALHRKGPRPMFPGQYPWAGTLDEAYAFQEEKIAFHERAAGDGEAA